MKKQKNPKMPKKTNLNEEDLFNVITEDDVLEWDTTTKRFKVGDVLLSAAETGNLISEARGIQSSTLWPYMVKALQLAANKLMYENSDNTLDLKSGKMMLYATKLIAKKIQNISELKN